MAGINEYGLKLIAKQSVYFAALPPLIPHLYGKGRLIQPNEQEWPKHMVLLPQLAGSKQIFELDVDLVPTSCGIAVPLLEPKDQHDELLNSKAKKLINHFTNIDKTRVCPVLMDFQLE